MYKALYAGYDRHRWAALRECVICIDYTKRGLDNQRSHFNRKQAGERGKNMHQMVIKDKISMWQGEAYYRP